MQPSTGAMAAAVTRPSRTGTPRQLQRGVTTQGCSQPSGSSQKAPKRLPLAEDRRGGGAFASGTLGQRSLRLGLEADGLDAGWGRTQGRAATPGAPGHQLVPSYPASASAVRASMSASVMGRLGPGVTGHARIGQGSRSGLTWPRIAMAWMANMGVRVISNATGPKRSYATISQSSSTGQPGRELLDTASYPRTHSSQYPRR